MAGFDGKVALVVGGTSGIGAATAEAFADLGARVVVAGRRELEGSEVAGRIAGSGGEAAFVRCDVRSEDDVRSLVAATVERFGRLDCAFNAAGIERYGSVVDLDAAEFDDVEATNLRGTFLCLKHEVAAIGDSGGGAIVNAASVAGAALGVPTNAPYAATKAGIVGLTRTAALEGAPTGVGVNCVCAANIASDMARAAWRAFGVSEDEIREHSPAGRIGTPADVANVVAFLCSERAGFVNGAALTVDGGWSVSPNL